jgi:hypothetical protein
MNGITRQSSYFDNTKVSTYKECPRKYLLRHVLDWTIESGYQLDGEGSAILKAPALVFGGAWHEGMDAMWAAQGHSTSVKAQVAMQAFIDHWTEAGYPAELTMEQQDGLGARTPGVAHEMFYNYAIAREGMLEECEVIAIEQPVAMPFPNLEDTWYIGKLDKVFRWNGIHIGEHKTTSMYAIKGNFQPDWTDSWGSSSQVKGYQMVGGLYHEDLQDVWVDGALVHKKVHDAFKFVPVQHSLPLLQEWIVDTGRWITEIQRELKEFREVGDLSKGTFRRNEDQCFGKYSRCPFLNICSTTSDPTKLKAPPAGYTIEKWEPFDELGIDRLVGEGDDKA